MKIEKGKLYYNTQEGILEMPMSDMEVDEGVLTDKIAVHCPTKIDYLYVRDLLGHIGFESDNDGIVVFIDVPYGSKSDIRDYHMISIDQFREFYPEQNKELETGKWYKTENDSCLFYHRGGNSSYGFQKGVWTENWDTDLYTWERDRLTVLEAGVEEVESALIEEAKRRGFDYDNYTFFDLKNILLGHDNDNKKDDKVLFNNGKWAEIIKNDDKFAELKEAHKNGAVIQCRAGVDREWKDCSPVFKPVWSNRYEYRIKPEEEIPAFDCGSRIDPVDFIVSNKFDFLEGCVIALVSQHKENDGLEDLKAAQHYLQRLIDRYES